MRLFISASDVLHCCKQSNIAMNASKWLSDRRLTVQVQVLRALQSIQTHTHTNIPLLHWNYYYIWIRTCDWSALIAKDYFQYLWNIDNHSASEQARRKRFLSYAGATGPNMGRCTLCSFCRLSEPQGTFKGFFPGYDLQLNTKHTHGALIWTGAQKGICALFTYFIAWQAGADPDRVVPYVFELAVNRC